MEVKIRVTLSSVRCKGQVVVALQFPEDIFECIVPFLQQGPSKRKQQSMRIVRGEMGFDGRSLTPSIYVNPNLGQMNLIWRSEEVRLTKVPWNFGDFFVLPTSLVLLIDDYSYVARTCDRYKADPALVTFEEIWTCRAKFGMLQQVCQIESFETKGIHDLRTALPKILHVLQDRTEKAVRIPCRLIILRVGSPSIRTDLLI